MISVRFDAFPLHEQKSFYTLCSEEHISPEDYFVFATLPIAEHPNNLSNRRVFVVHVATNRIHEYHTGTTAEWLDGVRKDLASGFFPKPTPPSS